MADSLIERHVEWVQENLPALAMRGEGEIRRIATVAVESAVAARTTIGIVAGAAGALIGHAMASYLLDYSISDWRHYVLIAGSSSLLAILSQKLADVVVHRKIEQIANIP